MSTKLDLRNIYQLVRVEEGNEWKTCFITPTGLTGLLASYKDFEPGRCLLRIHTLSNDDHGDMVAHFLFVYLENNLSSLEDFIPQPPTHLCCHPSCSSKQIPH